MKTSQSELGLMNFLILLENGQGSSISINNREANEREVNINIEADTEKDVYFIKKI